jgi:hypothetical protein
VQALRIAYCTRQPTPYTSSFSFFIVNFTVTSGIVTPHFYLGGCAGLDEEEEEEEDEDEEEEEEDSSDDEGEEKESETMAEESKQSRK